jgi:hypothetical protein
MSGMAACCWFYLATISCGARKKANLRLLCCPEGSGRFPQFRRSNWPHNSFWDPCAAGRLVAAHDPPRHIYICSLGDDPVFAVIADPGRCKHLAHLSFNSHTVNCRSALAMQRPISSVPGTKGADCQFSCRSAKWKRRGPALAGRVFTILGCSPCDTADLVSYWGSRASVLSRSSS